MAPTQDNNEKSIKKRCSDKDTYQILDVNEANLIVSIASCMCFITPHSNGIDICKFIHFDEYT